MAQIGSYIVTTKENSEYLEKLIIEALEANKGMATLIDVSKYIWDKYKNDLKERGNLFYTWQYDMRWSALLLRDKKILVRGRSKIWELTNEYKTKLK